MTGPADHPFPVEVGTALVRDAHDRPMDLAVNLKRFEQNRSTILKFVARQLTEAEYDDKGGLVAGKLNDYYLVPGSKKKALTKKGAENLCQLFRYAAGETKVVSSVESKEYVSFVVNQVIVDHRGLTVGSATSACSSAEKGFSSPAAQEKYGATIKRVSNQEWKEGKRPTIEAPPDYRSALNDIVARAGKRAFVQAVIKATATDEVFEAAADAGESESGDQSSTAGRAARQWATLPKDIGSYKKGTPITELTSEELKKLTAAWHDKKEYRALVRDAEEILEERRIDAELAGDPLA